jgi:hypothetical protein
MSKPPLNATSDALSRAEAFHSIFTPPRPIAGRILGLEPSEVHDLVEAKQTGAVQRFDGTADQDGPYSIEVLSADWRSRPASAR